MRRLAPRAAAVVTAGALLPGCYFTTELWDWAEDGRDHAVDAVAVEVAGWRRAGDAFVVDVAWSDGRRTSERVTADVGASPAGLLARARREAAYAPRDAAACLSLAVARGLLSRGFTDDPALAPARFELDLVLADAAPVVSPTFSVRPLVGAGAADPGRCLWLSGADVDPAPLLNLGPLGHPEGGGGRTAVAVLVTPLTVVLDVVSGPVQLVVLLLVLDAVAEGGPAH